MKSTLATLLELAGLASVSVGAFLIDVTFGLILTGIAVFALGYALERD
jgi:hypothetical protein